MDAMFILGGYIFSIDTAAPQELSRETSWRWPSQDVFGSRQALQFTGWGEDRITLQGVIYTELIGNANQLNEMRAKADEGLPLTFIDGRGNLLGEWCITSVSERQDEFFVAGMPQRQAFTMTMQRYNDVQRLSRAAGIGALQQLRMGNQSAIDSLVGLLGGSVVDLGISADTLGGIRDTLQGFQAGYAAIKSTVSNVQNVISTVRNVQATIKSTVNAVQALKNISDIDSAASALANLEATAGTSIQYITKASGQMAVNYEQIKAAASSLPGPVMGAMQGAIYTANQAAVTATKAVRDAEAWYSEAKNG